MCFVLRNLGLGWNGCEKDVGGGVVLIVYGAI